MNLRLSKSENHLFRNIFYSIVVFFFIFNFTISQLGITSAFVVIIGTIVAMFANKSCLKFLCRCMCKLKYYLLICLMLGAYGALLSHLWGGNELVYLGIFFKLIIAVCSSLVMIFFFRKSMAKEGVEFREAMLIALDIYLIACAIQALFVLASFISPEFRDALNNIVANRGNIDIDHPFRFRGLHDSGGFNLSVVLGVGAMYGLYSSFILNRGNLVLRGLVSIIIICSIMLVGRTGVAVCIMGLLLTLIRWPKKTLKAFLVVFGISTFVLIPILFTFFPDQIELFDTRVTGYAFEFIVNYQEEGRLATTSTDDLKTMLFVPDVFNLFFGNGSFDAPNVGVDRSDSGYMKVVLASGLFGFILFYGVIAYVLLTLAKLLRMYWQIFYFFVFFVTVLIVAEVKGPVFFQNDTSRLFMLFGCATLMLPQQFSNRHRLIEQFESK